MGFDFFLLFMEMIVELTSSCFFAIQSTLKQYEVTNQETDGFN